MISHPQPCFDAGETMTRRPSHPGRRFGHLATLAAVLLGFLPAVAAPQLEVQRPAAGTLGLRWSAANAGFVLEAADTLAVPTAWLPVAGAPWLLNEMNVVALPLGPDGGFFRLRSTDVLTTIASSSPANGETGVAITSATSIRFSAPLADEYYLNPVEEGPPVEALIYAEHNGVRLPATAEVSADGLTVTLSFRSDLPAGALIRVTANGSLLKDFLDRLVDADGRGSPGGVWVMEFETADNRPPDTDGDGLDDPTEVTLGTDPALWDTDEDGFSDGQEQGAATDPLAVESRPGIRLADGPGTVGEMMAAFPSYGPFAVGPDAIGADGQILSRIEAILNPQATPAIVNEALDAVGARIVMLGSDTLFVSLALPPRPGAAYSADEIKGITQRLGVISDESPFIFASQSFTPRPLLVPRSMNSVLSLGLRAHDRIRMPAAWNLLARTSAPPATPVRVLVPDFYSAARRHPQLQVQSFIQRQTGGNFLGTNGSHGFAVSSAIAANFDGIVPTGTYPPPRDRPRAYIEILSLPIGGLGMQEVINEVIRSIVHEQPDIVSTSFGFAKSSEYLAASRIHLAFEWQRRVRAAGHQFLLITAAGNDNDDTNEIPSYERMAEFSTPWSLAAKRGSLDHMILGATDLTPSEESQLRDSFARMGSPSGTFVPLDNVVIVGSIDPDGLRSTFSEPGEDVVAQGERLILACTQEFNNDRGLCDGTNWIGALGTSFAAPQVAGVAAYLLTQKPGLSPKQLRDALLNTRAGDVLDAYGAVLELDAIDSELPLRRRLLDVAGGDETDASGAKPDGKFDEKDLVAFVNAFKIAEALWQQNDPPDRSRFDLNGDGYTGGPGTARFILDLRSGTIGSSFPRTIVRNIRNLPVVFDETALTDFQILCFYAYGSTFYAGSLTERGIIIGAGCCSVPPMIAFYTQGRDTPSSAIRNSIHIIHAQTGSSIHSIHAAVDRAVGGPAWRPDGGELAYWESQGGPFGATDIIGYPVGNEEAETTRTHKLVTGQFPNYTPVYLRQPIPSGHRIFFVRVIRATGSATPFIGGNGLPRALANYSDFAGVAFPGGSWGQQESVSVNNEFAYVYADGLGWSIRTVGPGGGDRLIARDVGSHSVYGVAWSPDGQSLAYGSRGHLQLVSNQTLEVRTLDTNGVSGVRVSWSPDGRYIAYQGGNSATGRQIYAFDLTGGPLLNFGPGGEPAWSPDGKEIAFFRALDVWVHTIATGAERQLTFTPNFSEHGIVWRPGSKTEP